MIPKTIHFCWLSDDEYPDLIKKCIDSWKTILVDYDFIHWNKDRFNLDENIWVKQAFESGKYAFAADYIRLYAVYNFGGIYLDTDVEVIKSFDDLLDQQYFIGTEGEGNIEAGVFGSEARNPWIGKCLEYYAGRHFINDDGSLNTRTLPRIMMSQITETRVVREFVPNIEIEIRSLLSNDAFVYLYPVDFFCAKEQGTGIVCQTENTYSVHHFAMSWIPMSHKLLSNIKRFLIKLVGLRVVNFCIKALRMREIRQILRSK